MSDIAPAAVAPRPMRSAPGAAPVRAPSGYLPFIVRAAIVVGLAGPILLARFQLNLGNYYLNVGIAAEYLFIFVLILSGMARIDPIRLLLFAASVFVVFLSWVVNPEVSSSTSVMLFVASYAAFIFVARGPGGTEQMARWAAAAFGNIMMLCAIAGILQFFLQFVIHKHWLIDYTPYLPDLIRGGGIYNTAYNTGAFFKSNGFFLREPARFSQLIALAILCELSMRGRPRPGRLAAFGLALLLSYSGTGLLTLAFGLMFPLGRRTILRAGALGLGGIAVFGALGSLLNLSVTTSRIREFTAQGSSGFARFVAPFIFIRDYIDSTPWSLFIGHGPGSTTRTGGISSLGYEVAVSTWNKIVFEFGILGFAAISAFVFYAMIRSRSSTEVAAAVCLGWIILWGGIMLNADALCVIYVLVGAWGAEPRSRRHPGRMTSRNSDRIAL